VGSCEHGNGTTGSIKCGEFVDWLSDYYCWLLNEDCASWSYSKPIEWTSVLSLL
jgi:hypothetical protein